MIAPADEFGIWLDGRDGAEANYFVVVEAEAGIVVFEKLFGRRENARAAVPKVVK